jgi:hypothetical protein
MSAGGERADGKTSSSRRGERRKRETFRGYIFEDLSRKRIAVPLVR